MDPSESSDYSHPMITPGASSRLLPDLSDIPLIDAHCHPVRAMPQDEALTVSTFERRISLSFAEYNQPGSARRPLVREWPPNAFPRPTLMLNFLYRRLAEFLDTPQAPEQIIAARNERARQDYPGYVRALMRASGLEQLVVDTGYPPDQIPRETFAGLTQLPVWEIVRTEYVMNQARQKAEDFGRFVADYCAALDEALRDPHCVGLKSVIAYLTGLDIGPADPVEAAKLYPAFRQEPFKRDFKALRDYCFHLGLQLCMEHNKPMQIHCGFGDDDIVFIRSGAKHLYELLAFPPYTDCLVMLVHAGYPWAKEAAIMTQLLPNLYIDISQTNPFASYGVAEVLWEALQTAPISKILYGSDAFHLPELYLVGAKLGRKATAQVLSRLVEMEFLNQQEAVQTARHILHDNAVDLYQLAS